MLSKETRFSIRTELKCSICGTVYTKESDASVCANDKRQWPDYPCDMPQIGTVVRMHQQHPDKCWLLDQELQEWRVADVYWRVAIDEVVSSVGGVQKHPHVLYVQLVAGDDSKPSPNPCGGCALATSSGYTIDIQYSELVLWREGDVNGLRMLGRLGAMPTAEGQRPFWLCWLCKLIGR